MTEFFTTERVQRLRIEATRWIGTPFVEHSAIRGAGVDCVNLVAQLLIACGHAASYELPKYVMDGGKHNRTSQLVDWLTAREDFYLVTNRGEPQPGDVLCFTIGRSSHHCGILLQGKTFIHALYGRKVSFASLADKTFERALSDIFQPLEVRP